MERDDTATQSHFFHQWLNLQHEDLSELLQTLNLSDDDPSKNDSLSRLIDKNIQHFKDYIVERTSLGRNHVSIFFAPAWCTSLENSLLWIGGCRPSKFIRLVYSRCGSEFESELSEFLQGRGARGPGTLGEISATQLGELDGLRRKTIKEEEKMTSRLASLQEEVADQPLAVMAKKASQVGEWDDDTGKALDDHEKRMAQVLEEADQLRINTLMKVMDILTPKQAVNFLATSKKLHLCVHAWGQKRDEIHIMDQQ